MSLHDLTMTEASVRLRSGEVSPVELAESCLARIGETEGALNAYVVVTGEPALEAATAAEKEIAAGRVRGPMHGIPVCVKDLCDMAGLATTASSKVRHDHMADSDSAVVTRLKEAGAVIVGKTHTHEFAYGISTPTTRNPWNTDCIPGGSSGGTGASVAARGCFAGIGTDTGGSIRIPAALCGLVGLKPTYGRVSRAGVTSLSWSLDHVGPLARTVKDAANMLSVLAGYDARDPGSVDLPVPDYTAGMNDGIAGLRLGQPTNFYFDRMDSEARSLVEAAFDVLRAAGAEIVPVELPLAETYIAVEFGLCLPEASAYHEKELRSRADLYGEDVRTLLEAGELIPATDYIRALRVREQIKQGWAALMAPGGIDAVVAPTVPAAAARVDQNMFTWPDGTEETATNAYVRHSCPANVTGLPSITVPCGFTDAALPVGFQVIGRPFAEAEIVRIARSYEATVDWSARAPNPK
ncbi:MAG: amidase [Alphaproteobacteria bacterium]|nr:amidase [Alphaproteobacteria bacterium]